MIGSSSTMMWIWDGRGNCRTLVTCWMKVRALKMAARRLRVAEDEVSEDGAVPRN